jgi:hypothetical protein
MRVIVCALTRWAGFLRAYGLVQGPHYLDWEELSEQGAISMAAVPLYLEKQVVGIMTLASSERAAFEQCALLWSVLTKVIFECINTFGLSVCMQRYAIFQFLSPKVLCSAGQICSGHCLSCWHRIHCFSADNHSQRIFKSL